jgi:magnesium transporter
MLINCVAYQDGKKLADIQPQEIRAYLTRPDCFVWMALKDPGEPELAAMEAEFELHPLAIEDARHGHQRPKIEEYDDDLFVVVHTLEIAEEEILVGEVDIFVGRNYVLSVRNRAEKGFKEVRTRCEREPELLRHGSGYVLYTLMDAVVDRYFPVLDALETEFEGLEEKVFAGGGLGRENIAALYGLKQKLTTLKHAAGPLLEATGKLYGGRVPATCHGLQEYFRDVYDHLIRINQSIDALRELVVTAISVHAALASMQQGETTKRLAAGAALVAVPTMIAGVYGMNFRHMPELDWVYGYPFAFGLMVVLDIYLFWRFRKANWL